jgi:hypothetical protein
VTITKPLTQEQFLADVDAFCKRYGLSDRTMGSLATESTHFVYRLRAGYSPSLSTVERVYDFMIAYEREHGTDTPHRRRTRFLAPPASREDS